MFKYMVIEDPESHKFHPTVFLGSHQIWLGGSEETGEAAFEAGYAHLVPMFSAFFSMGQENPSTAFEEVLHYLDGISPDWLKQEALNREEYGGKEFTENVLDIIKERLRAA